MSRYKVKYIEKVEPPAGATTKRWYRFLIANDMNSISGLRSGSEKEVRKIVADSVKKLNDKYLTKYKIRSFNKPVNEASFTGNY